MKARAEAWQTANYAGPEADARTASARSVVDLNERRGQEINAAGLAVSANNKNISQNQMNNDFNAREAQKARDFQLEMWNNQNEYNSPANQRRLLAEAGYSPYLGYDSNTGVAGSTGSTSQGQAAAPLS